MRAVETIAALLAFVAAGLGPVSLAMRRTRAMGWVEWIAASYLTGVGIVGLSSVLLMMAGLAIGAWVGPACAAAGLAIALRWRPALDPLALDRLALPAIVVAAAGAGLLLLSAASSRHLHEDGAAFWSLKARSILRHGTFHNADFTKPERPHPRPRYPLLLPSAYAWIYRVSGADDDRPVRIALALLVLASLPVLAGILRERLSGTLAWWLVAAFAWIPVLARPPTGIVDGFSDYPLGLFLLLAVASATRWLEQGRPESAAFAALMLACATQTKAEGGAFAILAAVLLAVFGGLQHGRRGAIAGFGIALPGMAWLAAWAVASASLVPDPDVVQWTSAVHWDRLPEVLHRLFVTLGKIPKWGVFWYAVALVGILKRPRALEADSLLAASVAGLIFLYIGAWLRLPAESASNAMGSNTLRLLLQAAPLAFVWAARRLPDFR